MESQATIDSLAEKTCTSLERMANDSRSNIEALAEATRSSLEKVAEDSRTSVEALAYAATTMQEERDIATTRKLEAVAADANASVKELAGTLNQFMQISAQMRLEDNATNLAHGAIKMTGKWRVVVQLVETAGVSARLPEVTEALGW